MGRSDRAGPREMGGGDAVVVFLPALMADANANSWQDFHVTQLRDGTHKINVTMQLIDLWFSIDGILKVCGRNPLFIAYVLL